MNHQAIGSLVELAILASVINNAPNLTPRARGISSLLWMGIAVAGTLYLFLTK